MKSSLKSKLAILSVSLVVIYYALASFTNKRNKYDELIRPRTRQKYIHYECKYACGGWADRLKGILSAHAWALLTDRHLVIDIESPCPLEKLYDTNSIDWTQDLDFVRHESSKFNFWPSVKHKRRIIEYGWNDWRSLETENILEYGKEYDIISLNSGLMFMNAFSANPHLKNRIKELGYEPSRFKLQFLIHEWYAKLFKLKPEMEKVYQDFLTKTRKSSGYKLICAQIRTRKPFIANEKLARREYLDFIESTFMPKVKEGRFKIYVTTDNEKVKSEFAERFGAENVLSFTDSSSHMAYDFKWLFGSNLNSTCQKNRNTLVDFHMLKECDMAVVSHSGFGLLGVWNRAQPEKDLYVYSTEDFIKTGVSTNNNLKFVKIDDLNTFHFAMTKGNIL
jgi:hypothetical protein